MNEFKRMVIKVSDATNDVATIPTTNDHTDGSWLATDIYVGELFLNIADDILQTRTDAGIVTLYDSAGSSVNWGDILGTLSDQTDLQDALDTKQDTLISGTNIKTINGGTILGSGDISLDNDFINLNDTPEAYTGSGGYAVQVNAGETGLEFVEGVGKFVDGTDPLDAVYTDGNVGIGTTAPSTALDVVGAITVNDGNNNTKVGTGAGQGYTGTNQSAFGNGAGQNNTGGNQSAFGLYAGQGNTGVNQTAFGGTSGFSNTGYAQSAFGSNAGRSNTGNNQSSFGSFAGRDNTGDNQSAVGYNAGNNNTGDNNSNFGYESGYRLSDGTTVNTGSSDSVFLGSNTKALGASQTNQIVIGHDATGIGANSVTLGNNSIATTALKGNVGIGTTAPSGKLHIQDVHGGLFFSGLSATFNRFKSTGTSAGVGRDLLFSAQSSGLTPDVYIKDNGNVGIGTTAPTEKLEVSGNIKADGSVQVGDNTDTAIASNVGAIRYRTDGQASYADMCMETSGGVYEWVNIVTNTF